MKYLYILSLLVSWICLACRGGDLIEDSSLKQSDTLAYLDSLDNALAEMYHVIWSERDSLPYEFADTFEMRLEGVLRDPVTFDYPFDSLSRTDLQCILSDDGRMRVFNWLNPYTGSFRHFPAVFQVQYANGNVGVHNTRSHEEEEVLPHINYASLHRLNDSLYLAIGAGQFMGTMVFETVCVYRLDESGLTLANHLFPEEGSDTLVGSLWLDKIWYLNNIEKFDYQLPSVIDYDSLRMELTFPEFVDNETYRRVVEVGVSQNISPTDDTIHLRFNGQVFETIEY